MKKLFLLIIFLTIFLPGNAQVQQENRQILFQGKQTVSPDESISVPVDFDHSLALPVRRYLRVVGGGVYEAPFTARGETHFREMECLIDDCLESKGTRQGSYRLNLYGENNAFERCAFIRVPVEKIQNGNFELTLQLSSNDLIIHDGGRVNVEFEVYYPKSGRQRMDIYDKPDTLLRAQIPSGTYHHRTCHYSFRLPASPSTMVMKVVGQRFEGVCQLETPELRSADQRLGDFEFLPLKERKDKENYWVGVNLLSRSWPIWSLRYQGKEIFCDRIFDRASDVADFYIPLPVGLKGKGNLELRLQSEEYLYHAPYRIRSIELIEETARPLEIVDIPKYVRVGAFAGVLIETNEPDLHLSLSKHPAYEWEENEVTFAQPGLHVLRFKALKTGEAIPFQIAVGDQIRNLTFQQFLFQEGSPAYLSSGDEIYIDKVKPQYDYFFKWYIRSRVGNWYQFRPSYQWSGFREINPSVLRNYYELLSDLEIPYAWQVEGRTLAGSEINPGLDLLTTPMYRGKQAHENDGGYYYWQHFVNEGLFTDIRARYLPLGGIFAKHRPIYTEKGKFVHYDPHAVENMAEGAEMFVNNLRGSRGESTRHTGPSTLFRYFFQAGYEWVGAEQMYGAEDVILAALRGASKAYGKTEYGSLHAMQWGSGPFTDSKHSLRLFQSQALSYMNGTTHINTEEALWLDEYVNDRYSKSGQEHLYAQHQLLDYIQTHSRRGKMVNNIAVLQGRNCSWKCFGRSSMWSQAGEKWKFNQINESFDLLNVFYPESILNSCGPEGWFTTTPYGTVDLLPIEASEQVMRQYSTLIFLGWNTYNEEDFLRLAHFVKKGGTLVMSGAHANVNLQPDEEPEFPEQDRILVKMLGKNYKKLTKKTILRYGKGKIIYFPQKCYPSEPEICQDFENTMIQLAQQNMASELAKGMIVPGEKVNFSYWDSDDMRTLLLLNVNWNCPEEEGQAVLQLRDKSFDLQVRQYTIETIHCAEEIAVHPLSNTSEVLSIKKKGKTWQVMIQTTEDDEIEIFNSITGLKQILSVSGAGQHSITFK